MCVTCINRLKPVWETPSYFRSPLSVKMFRNVVVNVAVQAMTEFLRECQERMSPILPLSSGRALGLEVCSCALLRGTPTRPTSMAMLNGNASSAIIVGSR